MRDDIQNTKLKMQFDTIICSEVLEHIKKDKIAISNLVKLTKKGGCILITVPAHKWLFGCHDKNLGTFRRYTKNELIKKFTSNDVIVEKIRYWNLISLLPKFFYENYLKKQPEYKKTMDFLNKYPIMKFGLKILLRFDRTISRFFGITLMVKFRKI
jgi:SAM-dependent methyltransferase